MLYKITVLQQYLAAKLQKLKNSENSHIQILYKMELLDRYLFYSKDNILNVLWRRM